MPRLIDDQLFGRQTGQRVIDPTLIADDLRSKQFATVVDLLGYGEIKGFDDFLDENGNEDFKKNIFLDDTPLIDANGRANFQDVEVFFKDGRDDQEPLGIIDTFGPDRVEELTPVGVAVTASTSVSRTISGSLDSNGNQLIKMLRVTIQIPALQQFDSKGNIDGTEVKIGIRITTNDGKIFDIKDTFTGSTELSIKGKATSPYLKDYEIDLEDTTLQFPLNLTVSRITADSNDRNLFNDTNFFSFTTIATESQAYKGFAYIALRFDAQSFQSFPRRKYFIKGTKIKIPHNGTVDVNTGAISYKDDNGDDIIFNGTFKTEKEWSSDPAWILYDLLTTDKGFGGPDGVISEDSLDVFSFFEASKYASTIIEDPITGTSEPRFSCNVILNQRNDAYTLINDLCSVMNAMPFYSVGALQIGQDRPTNTTTNTSDAQYLFTNANVTETGFNYAGSGQRTKFTEVEVSYFDNETQQINYELVTASEVTALASFPSRYGQTRKTIKAFACTSRGQANRLGRWFLYTNLRETEICTFTTTLEAGVIVRPSMIIGIADSLRAGVRRGGRIKTGVSTTQIIVDDANNTDLTTSNSATLSVILSDGTVESRVIDSISDKTITVTSAFSSIPQTNSIWAIENTSIEFQTYRVISIKEENQTEYTITAIIHDVNKYSQVEDTTIPAQPRNITTLLDVKPAPSNLTATESIVVLNNRAVSKIFVTWQTVQGVKEYRVESQYENNGVEVFRVSRPEFELFESRSGTYKFKVQSYNALGVLSTEASSIDNFNAVGKTAVPNDVQNLRVETISDQLLRLRFDKSTDVDVVTGGTVAIRHSSLTNGNGTFSDAVDLVPELSGNVTEALVPALDGEYILKFKDDGFRLSSGEASVVVSNPDPLPKLLVLNDREDTDSTPFNGTKTACFFSTDLNGLVLGSTVKIDDASVSDFNAIQNFDFLDQNSTADGGTYDFANVLDLGGIQPLRLKRHFVTESFYPSDTIAERTAKIDLWDNFDALTAFSVNAKLTCAVTDLDPATSTSGAYTINNGSGGAGTIITIIKSSHGYSVGSFVTLDFTSGTGVDGDYEIISVPDSGTFTLTSATSLLTSGNCNFGAEFSQFNTISNGTLVGRGFKFRCEMISSDPAQSIEIVELGYIAELESRTETSLGNAGASAGGFIASGTSTKSVVFSKSFFTGQSGTGVAANSVLPSIGITIENLTQGDFFVLSNITGTGFDIDVKDSGGSNVNRNFKYTATGFGSGG